MRLALIVAAAVFAVVLGGCNTTPVSTPSSRCAFVGAPVVIRQDGAAILERWDLEDAPIWWSTTLPDDAAYAAFRQTIRDVHGELEHPVADPPRPTTEQERESWRREDQNVATSYSGLAGTIRPIECLEALLFARQNTRYPELTHPTEFVASILRKQVGSHSMVRIYVGASDTMFPPKTFYGFDETRADLKTGWTWQTVLHDHTIRTLGDQPALGVTSPSTSDVQLMRNLAEDGLLGARVTNGVFTIEIPATAFGRFTTRD